MCKGAIKEDTPHGKQSMAASRAHRLIAIEPGKIISTKLFFQVNQALISGIMMAAFVIDAMPANAAFQWALSNDIVAEYPELCVGAIP